MNINEVDPVVVKGLVNQWRERKPQLHANVDFQPEDAIDLPPDRVRASYELGA